MSTDIIPTHQQLQLQPLSATELYSLVILAQSDDHPYDLVRSIFLDSDERFQVTEAGLRKALTRMVAKGWIVLADKGRRHQYHLTDWGVQQLSFELDRLAAAAELGRRRLTARRNRDDIIGL